MYRDTSSVDCAREGRENGQRVSNGYDWRYGC